MNVKQQAQKWIYETVKEGMLRRKCASAIAVDLMLLLGNTAFANVFQPAFFPDELEDMVCKNCGEHILHPAKQYKPKVYKSKERRYDRDVHKRMKQMAAHGPITAVNILGWGCDVRLYNILADAFFPDYKLTEYRATQLLTDLNEADIIRRRNAGVETLHRFRAIQRYFKKLQENKGVQS